MISKFLDSLTQFTHAPARIMLALIFVFAGYGKIGGYAATQGYMEAFGLPGILLAPTIVFELGAGLALLIGYQTRLVAVLLAGFSVLSAIIFHANFADQMEQIMFMKNIAIAGGLLILAQAGSHSLSFDGALQRG